MTAESFDAVLAGLRQAASDKSNLISLLIREFADRLQSAHEAEVAELRDDARRYRWLRDESPDTWDVTEWIDSEIQEIHYAEYLDAAIDAATKDSAHEG